MKSSIQSSTIHGVADLFTAKNFFLKCFWVVVFLVAFAVMVFEMTKIIIEYRQHRLSTTVELVTMEAYPTVAFCPSSWINGTKAVEQGLDDDDLRYLLSHIALRDPAGIEYVSHLIDSTSSENITNKLHGIHDKLTALYGKNLFVQQNLVEFLTSISYDASIFWINTLSRNTVKKVMSVRGICYELSFHFPPVVWTNAMVKWDYSITEPSSTTTIQGFSPTVHIFFIGDDEAFVPNAFQVAIRHGYSVDLHITSAKHIKQNTERSPCALWSTYDRAVCVTDCLNRYALVESNCTVFTQIRNASIDPMENNVCNLFNSHDGEMEDFSREYEKCAKMSCPRPCSNWFHQVTLDVWNDGTKDSTNGEPTNTERRGTLSQKSDNNETVKNIATIVIYHDNVQNAMVFEEFPTFTWETLLCNLGGILSLFFGASLLSIIQLFAFCCEIKLSLENE